MAKYSVVNGIGLWEFAYEEYSHEDLMSIQDDTSFNEDLPARRSEKHSGKEEEFVRFWDSLPVLDALTLDEECGKDMPDIAPPDGSQMPYHQWRLVQHSLREVAALVKTYARGSEEPMDVFQAAVLTVTQCARRVENFWEHRQRPSLSFRARTLPEVLKTILSFESSANEPANIHDYGIEVPDLAAEVIREEAARDLSEMLGTISPLEERVVSMRVGLGERSEHSWEEIAESLGKAVWQVTRIAHRAGRKLRHPSRRRLLRAHHDHFSAYRDERSRK